MSRRISPRNRAEPCLRYETTLEVRDHCLCLFVQRAARALARRFDEALRHLRLTHGQMGVLSHHAGDPKAARAHLGRAGPRATDAQMLLAALQYRDGEAAAASRTLERAALANRRHAMLPNVQAFLLHEQGKTDQALAVLSRFLKREPGHEASKDNLLRLQNERKLNMKSFGMPWYALGLEDPPASMGVMQTGRKGFRTPPKKRRG